MKVVQASTSIAPDFMIILADSDTRTIAFSCLFSCREYIYNVVL